MQQLELTPVRLAELEKLQSEYSAFISADYMMGKNLPHWGKSAQPSKTYYMMKLVCDVFGIVDHSSNKEYTYLCDEVAAGSKSTDHTPFLTTMSGCTLMTGYSILPYALTMPESAKINTL